MGTFNIATGGWVVVCDGRKALFTVNAGDAQYLNLKVVEERESPSPPTHEQGTDRPGRVHQSMGSGRSSVGQTDWHDQAERDFLKSVAERINVAVRDGDAKDLVIAAPPRALGVLKPLLSAAANATLRHALDKDYVHMPVYEIEKHLAKAG
jgi:protein required for attachment to host cells